MRNSELVFQLLGIKERVPLDLPSMAAALKVTFFPPHGTSDRLEAFVSLFRQSLVRAGVQVIPFDDALAPGSKRVKPGIVIVEQGEGREGEFAVHRVSGLYQNPLVAIFDGPPPIPENASLQEMLDGIVGVLAWNQTHTPIFVEEREWTVCTMNGAVIRCGNWRSPDDHVLHSLIPKLSAQVVPPNRTEILYREGAFDFRSRGYDRYVEDFQDAARIWRDNGRMLSHTSITRLAYRNEFYRRLVATYLDHRTGMSYGFLVRQLPTSVDPAVDRRAAPAALRQLDWDESPVQTVGEQLYAKVDFAGGEWIVRIPEIWLLSTRSGCDKANLDPQKDLVRLGLSQARIILETPHGIGASDARPSYDTYAILAHGLGNAIAASLLLAGKNGVTFPVTLRDDGLSISHWHGYPDASLSPLGYTLHGTDNPPVSCSTPQSAVFSLCGKLAALEAEWSSIHDYKGDVHVEPHHGTNITASMSLKEAAGWVDALHDGDHVGASVTARVAR